MKILATAFQLPAPVLVAGLAQRFPSEVVESGPAWFGTFILGIWVAGWFANILGYMPKGKAETQVANFREEDRNMIRDLHSLFHSRDSDGIERFPRFLQEARRGRAEQTDLHDALRETNERLNMLVDVLENRADIELR